MNFDVDLQALRDCCRDEAAFERLQQLLTYPNPAQSLESEGMYQLQARLSPDSPTSGDDLRAVNAQLKRRLLETTLQLQQQSIEFQALKRQKEILLHTLAHDLRTSLMGVSLVCKNLLNQAGESVELPRLMVERIIEGSDRQVDLIASLLAAQNHDEQGIILHPEPRQFHSLVEEAIQELEPVLTEHQASLTNQVAIDLPPVMADSLQIRQILGHLITCRLKHSSAGIVFALNAEIVPGNNQQPSILRCTITDNGTGISTEECSRLFNLPIQNPRSCCPTEVGLKLYLCRQIITAHGGQIGVISPQEQGIIVWFTLPSAT